MPPNTLQGHRACAVKCEFHSKTCSKIFKQTSTLLLRDQIDLEVGEEQLFGQGMP